MVGIDYTPLDVDVDEDNHFVPAPAESPADEYPRIFVISLSEKKARTAASTITEGIVAAADTIVYLDGNILNKPKDREDAVRMLTLLSGRTHQVFTGFTILEIPGNRIARGYEVTEVTFRKLNAAEIEEYVRSDSPYDKAGAYGIQGDLSALFVEKINGDFYNVVGMPLVKFCLALKDFSNA